MIGNSGPNGTFPAAVSIASPYRLHSALTGPRQG
jgi:hypothetical protein